MFSLTYPPWYSITENKLNIFIVKILRLQQDINLSEETVYPIRLIFHYMKELPKRNKIKSLIAPKMTDLITFLGNNVKLVIYTGGTLMIYNMI